MKRSEICLNFEFALSVTGAGTVIAAVTHICMEPLSSLSFMSVAALISRGYREGKRVGLILSEKNFNFETFSTKKKVTSENFYRTSNKPADVWKNLNDLKEVKRILEVL